MRENTTPNPEVRLFESYMSFAGGHNSEISNDRLKDDEFPIMDNVDLSGRDSAKRRTGRELFSTLPANCQGHFLFYRVGQSEPNHVFAAGGKLYKDDGDGTVTEITTTYNTPATTHVNTLTITGGIVGESPVNIIVTIGSVAHTILIDETDTTPELVAARIRASTLFLWTIGGSGAVVTYTAQNPGAYTVVVPNFLASGVTGSGAITVQGVNEITGPFVFQTDRMVEAVQYGTTLFIASGSGLIEMVSNEAGTVFTAEKVTPYTPSVQEVIYIGTNGLADDPSSYVTDNIGATLTVAGVTSFYRSGAVNMELLFTAYINKPSDMVAVEYKWEYRLSGATSWTEGRDWTLDASGGKSFELEVAVVGTYDVRVTVRDEATPATTATASVVGYRIEATLNKENNTQDVSGINTCSRIRLHWDRILLFGDTANPFLMYISDLKNPRYFPSTSVLSFDTGKLEPVNAVVRFQDYLVVMTLTTIQTLIGKDPTTYARYLIHDSIGCIAPRSAEVAGNQIVFLSYSGMAVLRPNPYRIEAMNVKRIDTQINREIMEKTITTDTPDLDACSMFFENQYWVCFPATKTIFRFYHERGVWVRDSSTKLNIIQFTSHGGRAYNLTNETKVYRHVNDDWSDDGEVYTMELDAKLYDLGHSFNYKKMRRIYVLAKHFDTDTPLYVKVYADSAIVLTPESGQAVIIGNGTDTVWQTTNEPNMHFYAGTIVGTWVLGVNPLGDIQLSVQQASIQGKCRRVKANIKHIDNAPCEIYGIGFEFKLKKV